MFYHGTYITKAITEFVFQHSTTHITLEHYFCAQPSYEALYAYLITKESVHLSFIWGAKEGVCECVGSERRQISFLRFSLSSRFSTDAWQLKRLYKAIKPNLTGILNRLRHRKLLLCEQDLCTSFKRRGVCQKGLLSSSLCHFQLAEQFRK